MINNKIYKPLEEATREELIAIYNNNTELQKDVEHLYMDWTLLHIDEVIRVIMNENGLYDYSVGFNYSNYLAINDNNFTRSLKEVNKWYGTLEEYDELIDECLELENRLYYMDYENKQYGNLSHKVRSLQLELLGKFKGWLDEATTIEDEDLIETFIEFHSDDLIAKGNFYYDKDYNLVEEVHHIRGYS